ncbi:HAMP domain-containing sensor histidine kinase [Mycobacterium sp. 236(2023)]|uniref:sensor histidine kinase n=1 Tax=Mycobacterium sp. 236(2023) TaxID=3038163 RepID=UPI0024152EAE|nr:HAMP domain-containing sensor histidine kinase [Mycobacterium sp. 236(2023)]MDG4665041.1 HAMP domain-containing sensor histidine kinase [Mycobacterium sp. 236(2023)]
MRALSSVFHVSVRKLDERDFVLQCTAIGTTVPDPQRITQTLVALADNACRSTRPNGWIGVGSELSGGWLKFWVSDSGPGVSTENRARIFERFARGEQIGAHHRRCAQGDVMLDSALGRGSTFTVFVPAGPAPTATAETKQPWPQS